MIACEPLVLGTAAALTTVLMTTSAFAVSLRPNKATDDSVCDLAHDTNLFLGSKVLVPSVATKKDQVDAYFRLAASFVASKCRNGQALILQGATASSVDVQSLTEVANSACAVAAVARTEVKLPLGDVTQAGFELRCTILKHDDLVARLNEIERADPMDALKARLTAAAQQAELLRPALISALCADLSEAEQGCLSCAGNGGTRTQCSAGRQVGCVDGWWSTNGSAASGEAGGGVVALVRSAFQNGGSSKLSKPGSMSWLPRSW